MADAALRTARGVIGFIPRAAIDRSGRIIELEVDIELTDGTIEAISIVTSPHELRSKLNEPQVRGLGDLRAWIFQQAKTEYSARQPQQIDRIRHATDIYWICGPERNRYQFLR